MNIFRLPMQTALLLGILFSVGGPIVDSPAISSLSPRSAFGAQQGPPQGSITFPKNDATVGRVIDAKGTVSNVAPNQRLVLAIEIGTLAWWKQPFITPRNETWATSVVEGGNPPGGRFILALYALSGESLSEATQWIQRGRETGQWPGISVNTLATDAIRLDSVSLKLAP